jgi:hypothetical protein
MKPLPLLALFGPHAMFDLSPERAAKRTSADHSEFMVSIPNGAWLGIANGLRPRPDSFAPPILHARFAPDGQISKNLSSPFR